MTESGINDRMKKILMKRSAIYRSVFSGEDGQWVLRDLMKRHHLLQSSYRGSRDDTVFREGERNVVLGILSVLKTDPVKLEAQLTKAQEETENEYRIS